MNQREEATDDHRDVDQQPGPSEAVCVENVKERPKDTTHTQGTNHSEISPFEPRMAYKTVIARRDETEDDLNSDAKVVKGAHPLVHRRANMPSKKMKHRTTPHADHGPNAVQGHHNIVLRGLDGNDSCEGIDDEGNEEEHANEMGPHIRGLIMDLEDTFKALASAVVNTIVPQNIRIVLLPEGYFVVGG